MGHPHQERENQAAFLELFFDLVFVFAITQVAAFIHHHHDPGGFLQAVVIFALVWWGWSQYTWTLNGIDVGSRVVHIGVLVATVFAFFMAQGLQDAYTGDGEWFSIPFALTMAVGLGLYWWGLRNEPEHQRALVTYLPVAAGAVLVAAITGFLPDAAQEWGYAATVLLFLAAGIASAYGTPFHIYPKHFAERHGLIVIIAMGESIIAVGIGAAELERTVEFAIAVGLGAAAVCVLWWTYFDWLQEALEHGLRRVQADFRAPLARDAYTFAHLPIVLGIVFVAVATEEVIAHPTEPLADYARFALAAGDGIFFAGTVAAYYRSDRVLMWERSAAAVLIPLIVLALPNADAIVIAALTTSVKAAALVAEWFRSHPGRAHVSTA